MLDEPAVVARAAGAPAQSLLEWCQRTPEPDDLEGDAVDDDRDVHERETAPPPHEHRSQHREHDKGQMRDQHDVGNQTPLHNPSVAEPGSSVRSWFGEPSDRSMCGRLHAEVSERSAGSPLTVYVRPMRCEHLYATVKGYIDPWGREERGSTRTRRSPAPARA